MWGPRTLNADDDDDFISFDLKQYSVKYEIYNY